MLTGTQGPTRRLGRVRVPERASTIGISVGELEDRARAAAEGRRIDHDLTSASTLAFPPPPYFVERIAEAVRDGRPGYTSQRGDLGVRETIAPRIAALLGVSIDPARELLLTSGTQAGIFATLASLVQAGDTVLLADPEYLCDERTMRFLGADVRYVPFARLGDDAELDLDVVEQGLRDGAKLLMFSNPHNPTGSVMGEAAMRRLAALLVEHDAWVLSDELYARFAYEPGTVAHLAALPGMRERCITAIGPSKTENASGFRIGVLVGPAAVLDEAVRITEITTVRASAYAQYALAGWLLHDDAEIAGRIARYRALRDLTVPRLQAVEGVELHSPPATAWLFPDVRGLGRCDLEVVEALIDVGVLVMPGASFGPSGVGHFRMCFGQPEAGWPAAVDRIAETLDGLRR